MGLAPDAYALLGLTRGAALDHEALHQAYVQASRIAHPDHGGSEAAATAVNAAYETLQTPEKRLKHLLEIAGPPEASAWRTVPMDDGMMQLFSRLGKAIGDSGKFLERKEAAQSALAKALLTSEEFQHREVLEEIGTSLEAQRSVLENALPELDILCAQGDADAWKQLAMFQARFAYLTRWQTQIRERLLALM